MSYQALYRKYRPRLFSQVLGQEHITTTLKNQVVAGHVAHAYLFCGSRGTGKTSTAKILARAVNCLHPQDGEPCGVCESCRRSDLEDTVDIIELDAASNTGVEDMRQLLEKARFTPLHLPKKVYIIDEVHALSNNAFNALLKTLEEPPSHVVFILATTEPQKLPATVVSRCQRYDFHRLSMEIIIENLKSVLSQAGAQIEAEGLDVIARAADGGMRDALSLADQCLAFCGEKVSAQDVYDVLGSMDQGFLFDVSEALVEGDAGAALRQLNQVIQSGRDLSVFVQDLAQHMRALLVANACGSCADILDCTKETMARYQAQAAKASEARLLSAMQILIRTQSEMRYLRQPRVLVESALVRICRPEDALNLLALEDRIARLEARLESGVMVSACTAAPQKSEASSSISAPPWEMDAPPLPEAPPAPSDAGETCPLPEPPPPAISAPPADKGKAVAASSGPQAVWEKLRGKLQTKNISLFILAKNALRATQQGNTLTIWFAQSQSAAANALNTSRNFSTLVAALKELDESLQLHIQVEALTQPVDPELTRLFGEKLVIEE